MAILQWISTLDGRPLQEVLRVWQQMGFTLNPVVSKTARSISRIIENDRSNNGE
jgi:hypothetical protein